MIGVSRATVYRMLKGSDQAAPKLRKRTVEQRVSGGTLASDEAVAALHDKLSREAS